MKIVYWWDRYTRTWIIQVLDEQGYEIDYSQVGDKNSRDFEIKWLQKEHNIEVVEKLGKK